MVGGEVLTQGKPPRSEAACRKGYGMHVSATGVPIPSHTANPLYDAQEKTKRDATLASTRNQLLVVSLNRFCSTSSAAR